MIYLALKKLKEALKLFSFKEGANSFVLSYLPLTSSNTQQLKAYATDLFCIT